MADHMGASFMNGVGAAMDVFLNVVYWVFFPLYALALLALRVMELISEAKEGQRGQRGASAGQRYTKATQSPIMSSEKPKPTRPNLAPSSSARKKSRVRSMSCTYAE